MAAKTELFEFVAEDVGSGAPVGGYKSMDRKHKFNLTMLSKQEGKSFPKKKQNDPFPDTMPINPESVKKHANGLVELEPSRMRSSLAQKRMSKKKKTFQERADFTARAELLNQEESGFMETDDGELTYNVKQHEIAQNVDLASASKHFDLHLEQFGPYRFDYTDNGRHLLIGGKRGHVAALDWQTKKLHSETNVLEGVRDVKWLHTENMFAVAQRNYTYIYDDSGVELHCLKNLDEVKRLEFLQRHFLLVGSSRKSFLHFLDVSVGRMVCSFPCKQGSLDVMCQNPANAIIHTAHGDGTVSLWSPNSREPLVKMLAHRSPVTGIAVDDTGDYMVTNGLDGKCRVWDVRMYRQLHAYKMPSGASHIAISQKKAVACAIGNTVQVFRDMHLGVCHEPYLAHRCGGPVSDLRFVPYEDVLGVGHSMGFTSILVPGAGEANVDALRANPYETKSQKREREVRQLLDKLQPDLICLDPNEIARVNTELLEKNIEEAKSKLWVTAPTIDYKPRHRMKGRSKAGHKEARKNIVRGEIRLNRALEKNELMKNEFGEKPKDNKPKKALDRFRPKP